VKLYLVTRKDLAPGARASQLVHAMRQFTEEHPGVDREWFTRSNTVVLLEVPTEQVLEKLEQKARIADVPVSIFREPDLDNALTALTLGPSGAKLVRNLPLAFT
jgi:peptidyl-tRNA hydrolase